MSVSAHDERRGTIVGHYRLQRPIGRGGAGVVYSATHERTGRRVAVKLVRDDTDAATHRTLAEARVAAAIRHPSLVEVLDVGEAEPGLTYLALELLHGESLASYLDRNRVMRPDDAIDVAVPILDALGAVHAANVVHRDIKPSNIFLSEAGDGRVVPKLLDFGVCKQLGSDGGLTKTGAIVGTPSHLAPEQARGDDHVGPAADLWAMGVVLYECLSGAPPFEGSNSLALVHQIVSERPVPLGERAPAVASAIAEAVDRALAYAPCDRYATCAAFAEALIEAAMDAGLPLTCRLPSGPRLSLQTAATADADLTPAVAPPVAAERDSFEPGPGQNRRGPIFALAAGVLAVLIAALTWWSLPEPTPTPPQRPETALPAPEPISEPEPPPSAPIPVVPVVADRPEASRSVESTPPRESTTSARASGRRRERVERGTNGAPILDSDPDALR